MSVFNTFIRTFLPLHSPPPPPHTGSYQKVDADEWVGLIREAALLPEPGIGNWGRSRGGANISTRIQHPELSRRKINGGSPSSGGVGGGVGGVVKL